MIEIICVILLWKINGNNAIARGRKPGKYRALTLGLWFGLEILGSMVGVMMAGYINPDANPMALAYTFGIVGAAIGGMLSFQIAKRAPQGDFQQQALYLVTPATIKIIKEADAYDSTQDVFFLNGYPVCTLTPGTEYTFATQYIKNILTIGRPTQTMGDSEHEVHFVAADNGYIEIHARAGKLLPQEFKNYTS